MMELGKLLVMLGVVLVGIGILVMLGTKAHLPVGRMPGDIVYRGRNTVIYFPIITSIILSVVLTLVFLLFGLFRR